MKSTYFFVIALFVVSCGPSLETTTVRTDTSELFNTDTTTVETANETDEFIQLKLGEVAPIHSLDPLFAETNSELRVNNLIYEQLIGMNQWGDPAPELAQSWDVNNDSTEFTLHLRTDIYYHDSPVFDSGTGRRFSARDVRYAFERMADNDVPDFAAQKYGDIRGFEAYHKEQTLIKNPAQRVIPSIEGLKTPNDSTVTFILERSSGDFLQRLMHPYASMYPAESVPNEIGPIQRAAGTGRFAFIQKNDNAHLFTVNENYRGVTPKLSRLDIISGLDERDLYQNFARNDLDALIEVSFPTLQTITDSTNSLIPQFQPIYKLQKSKVTATHIIYYNEESKQSHQVNALFVSVDTSTLLGNSAWGSIRFYPIEETSLETKQNNQQLVATHLQHHNERILFNNLASASSRYGYPFAITATSAPTPSTTFTTLPYPDTIPILRWEAPIYVLSHNSVNDIQISHKPWELDLVSVTISEDEQ